MSELIESISRDMLIKIAEGSRHPMSEAMKNMVRQLEIDGRYTAAKENNLDKFGILLDKMEAV